ncbi:MAG: serine/threonine protein kinase [Gemmatimonadaceae bacterium]|nr:serine/threonine protein kinase [Gemmatimonadaceae bacterium]
MTPPTDFQTLSAALDGQYHVERELGRGGMGVVYLARDLRLDRPVALKVLPGELAARAETRERFLREARTAAQLAHPHIVPVYRADETNGVTYFAMGYVDGDTLGQRLRDRGPLPVVDVVRVLREVAWALAYAHVRGVVHRDVKPDNILIERATNRAIVTDFGIARADFNPALTQDGMVLGTVHYMSPEQATGEPIDGRSDLYALGVVGYQALSGRLPFDAEVPHAVLVAHATKAAPALASVAPAVPAAVCAVIDRCLRKTAGDRFETGEALADALTRALEDAAHAADAQPGQVISEAAAKVIWQRAAQLQAEAAQRLDARTRESRAALAPGSAGTGAASGSTPTSGYRLRDVEAAAVEAGISQRYVALALAEQRSERGVVSAAPVQMTRMDRAAMRILGTKRTGLSVSRVIAAPARDVLAAVGRVLRGTPYGLVLRETVGGHPLDGGVLVFDFSDATNAMTSGVFMWSRWGLFAKEVRCTLREIGNGQTELSLYLDIKSGVRINAAVYGALSVGAGTGGGAIVAGFVSTMGLAALATVAATGLGAIAALGAAVAATGPVHRWEERCVERELDKALNAVRVSVEQVDVFNDTGRTRPVIDPFAGLPAATPRP